jgi:hypothetical protein
MMAYKRMNLEEEDGNNVEDAPYSASSDDEMEDEAA